MLFRNHAQTVSLIAKIQLNQAVDLSPFKSYKSILQ